MSRSRQPAPAGSRPDRRPARSPLWSRHGLWAGLIVTAATLAVFGPALRGGYVWDDRGTVLADPRVQGAAPLAEVWRGPFLGPEARTYGRAYYRPLTTLSLRADRWRGGGDPRPFHQTNLLLHLAASLLVLAIARRWLPGDWPALGVALLFALHPSRTESVCWISGRTDLLAGLGQLGSWWLFLRAGEGSRRAAWLSPVLFALALLAKESALVLPALLLLYVLFTDAAPTPGGRWRRALVRTAPHWILAGLFLVVLTRLGVLGGPPARLFAGPAAHALYVLQTLDLYGARLLWPVEFGDLVTGLLPEGVRDHPLPHGFLPVVLTVVPAVVTLSLWWFARRRPRLAFALAAWPVALLPVLNLVPLPAVAALRLMYVPLFFAAVAAGLAGAALHGWLSSRGGPGRLAVPAVALVLLAALGTVSRRQCHVWRDETTFWEAQVGAAPRSANALFLSGWSLLEAGRPEAALARLDRAVAIAPDNPLFLLNEGNALLAVRRPADAERVFRRLQAAGEGDGTPADRLAVAVADQGRLAEARGLLQATVARFPANVEFRADLGVLLLRMQQPREAAAQFEAVLRVAPDHLFAWLMLGRARQGAGDRAGALQAVGRGLALAPSEPRLRALQAELTRPDGN
ncbi:MAG: tetratricopeptide repeat protein [Candidatus Krumholzibacteriia bacterium]